nr:cytochrome c oxidase protein 20 homolog [Aotus nancymaae]
MEQRTSQPRRRGGAATAEHYERSLRWRPARGDGVGCGGAQGRDGEGRRWPGCSFWWPRPRRAGGGAESSPWPPCRSPTSLGKRKPFKLLGILDVENIPCARDSILYGSLGSVVAGFGHFLLTSRIRRSCDVGVGGFILVTLGCWFHCRYNYAKQKIQQRITRQGMKNKLLYEGTHLDPERKQNSRNSSN